MIWIRQRSPEAKCNHVFNVNLSLTYAQSVTCSSFPYKMQTYCTSRTHQCSCCLVNIQTWESQPMTASLPTFQRSKKRFRLIDVRFHPRLAISNEWQTVKPIALKAIYIPIVYLFWATIKKGAPDTAPRCARWGNPRLCRAAWIWSTAHPSFSTELAEEDIALWRIGI